MSNNLKRIVYALPALALAVWALGAASPSAIFRWINILDAQWSLESDEDDSAGCSWTTTTVTCTGKNVSTWKNKTLAIEYAGSSFFAFVGKTGSTVSNGNHTINIAAGTPTTVGPLSHVTGFGITNTGGAGFLVGDLGKSGTTCTGSCINQATGRVDRIGFSDGVTTAPLPTCVGGLPCGSGSTLSDGTTCDVVGTTGTPMAGNYILVNVTITGGKVSAINSYDNATGGNASYYRANMTNYTAEPMGSGTCSGLSGATFNFTNAAKPVFEAIHIKATGPTAGYYSAVPTCSTWTATTGLGTGATVSCDVVTATVRVGTDNTAAFTAIMAAQNTQSGTQNPFVIYMPAGKYFTKPTNTPINGFGCIKGDEQFHTDIFLIPNTAGDFYSTLNSSPGSSMQNLGGTVTFSDETNPMKAGGCVRGWTGIGMRSSSAIQNLVMFYGNNRFQHIEDFQCFYVRGRAIGTGANLAGQAVLFESSFIDNRFESCGDAAADNVTNWGPGGIPTIDMISTGATAAPNGLHFWNNRVFDSFGPCIRIAAGSSGGNGNAHLISWDGSHCEGSGIDDTEAAADLMQLGDPCILTQIPKVDGTTVGCSVTTGGVANLIGSGDIWNNGQGGFCAIHFYGTSATGQIANNILTGAITASGGAGNMGICLDAGNANTIRMTQNSANDWQLTAGTAPGSTTVGPGNMYDCQSAGCAFTAKYENDALPGQASAFSFPLYTQSPGRPVPPIFTEIATASNTGSGSQTSMFGAGIGATRLGTAYPQVGTTCDIEVAGFFTTTAGPGNLQFFSRLAGSSLIGSTTLLQAETQSETLAYWSAKISFTFYSIDTVSTLGTAWVWGTLTYASAASAGALKQIPLNNGGTIVTGIDTNSVNNIVFATQWQNAGQNITSTNAVISCRS